MPPAERPTTGYLARALVSGARAFHFRTGVRTLLTGIGGAASLRGARQPLPGYPYASAAPAFDLHGGMEFPAAFAASAVRAAAGTPASLQTGSSAVAAPRMARPESVDEYGARPPSAPRQTGTDAPRAEHRRVGSGAKNESRSEKQVVSIAPQLIAIPEPRRSAPADLMSAVTPNAAPLARSAPPITDRARKQDPIGNERLRPMDLRTNRAPVEHAAKLPDTAIGLQPNLAPFPTVPPHALHMAQRTHAGLVSETQERSPSSHPTPPQVPWPNTRMAPFDRAASGQRASHPLAPRPESARTTPTRAPLDRMQQRALRALEQLRHSVPALMSKPQAAQPAAPAPVVPPRAPSAPKVVVVRPSADRARRGSAFWERRYLGHPQLRVFR